MSTTPRTPMAAACAGLLAAALLAAPFPAAEADPAGRAGTPGWQPRTVDIGGTARIALVRAPAQPPVRAIVFLLHGFGGTPEQYLGLPHDGRPGSATPAGRWIEIADREGLLLVAPRGSEGPEGQPGWNDCRSDAPGNPGTDDVAFFETLARALRSEYRVAASRTFVSGFSNGGHMALRLAIERPANWGAVAAIAAAMPARSECAAARRPMRVLIMNGTADSVLPFGGGAIGVGGAPRGSALGSVASVEHWAALASTRRPPRLAELPDRMAEDGSRVRTYRYMDRGGRAASVELVEILGGGHSEPSASRRSSRGSQNGDIESAELVWDFFNGGLRRND